MVRCQRINLHLLPLLCAAVISYATAFSLRFEFSLPNSVEGLFVVGLCIFPPIKCLVFWIYRLHAVRWRWVGVLDLYRLVVANAIGSALAFLMTSLLVGSAFPRSVYVIDAALCVLTTCGVQCAVRLYWEVFMPQPVEKDHPRRVLIYGAGAAGAMLCKEICSDRKLQTRVLGFLDDDEGKQWSSVAGAPVLGRGCEAASVVARLLRARKPVSEVIIAMPSATARQMRAAFARCRRAGIPFRTLPGLSELLRGSISRQIRNVSPNDLLGRESVHIDETRIGETIRGETVLVTGGCGSIGSELCRQLACFEPRKLVIFDQAESEMYMLAMELRKRHPNLDLITEIGDIVRAPRVKETMAHHAVTIVFHAAAYKHVPLMEENIPEAIENNVIGTYNVAHWAHWAGVKKFVLISSDKAVNPTSIMGVTKRVAERIISSMPMDSSPKRGAFCSVRFGNVLGSSGSVIPIFQRQIASGGPVTVTHPDMRRYFMSISEAVQLVLQASTMGEGSEVFVLDMGDPVRILDLATNMVRLAGLVPGKDIEIRITGLRPGEKLYEELRLDHESVLSTPHDKIKKLRSSESGSSDIALWMNRMRLLLVEANEAALKAHLVLLVPEYQGTVASPREHVRRQLVPAS